MKKSVLVMAGLLAIALAGSAQAAPMFAVQDATGTIDKFTVDAAGQVNAEGQPMIVGGKVGVGLQNAVGPVALTGPLGSFHSASKGNNMSDPSFYAQHIATCATANCTTFQPAFAPNFSFYRINQKDDASYVMPLAGDILGYFNFGTLIPLQDPNTGGRKNVGGFYVRAESDWSGTAAGVPNVTPTYFLWSTTTTGAGLVEKMRLSSAGNLGIGMLGNANPTSRLQVIGLQTEPSPGVVPTGLTSGAFYKTATGVVMVAP